MNITMQNLERLSLAEMKEFVAGNRKACFSTKAREETYAFIEGTLQGQQYRKLSKGQKGIVRRFLVKVTGLSRAHITRLVGCWTKQRCIPTKAVRKRRRFARRYTGEDIRLLASVDAAHEDRNKYRRLADLLRQCAHGRPAATLPCRPPSVIAPWPR